MKKAAPRKSPASKARGKAMSRKRPQTEPQKDDSDDIERAVYDGMQDLRVKKPR